MLDIATLHHISHCLAPHTAATTPLPCIQSLAPTSSPPASQLPHTQTKCSLSGPSPPPQAQLKPELPLPESTLPTEQASLVLHSLIRSHLFLGTPHPTPGTSTFREISLTFDIPRHFTSSLIRAQILVYLIQPHK